MVSMFDKYLVSICWVLSMKNFGAENESGGNLIDNRMEQIVPNHRA
jgi:hypothetical protein